MGDRETSYLAKLLQLCYFLAAPTPTPSNLSKFPSEKSALKF